MSERLEPSFRARRAPARRACALALLLLGACDPPPRPAVHAQSDPLQPPASPALPLIDVRRMPDRPRLTLIAREGDPSPALVMAVAAQLGSAGNTALAALLESRLERAGIEAGASSDGLGFRIAVRGVEEEQLEPLLKALAAASSQAVGPSEDLALVRDRLAALRRRPLDGAPLAPLAACSAELGVLASEPLPDVGTAAGRAAIEGWRAEGLSMGRISLALVGPREAAAEAADALEDTGGWPPGGAAVDRWPSSDQHGAYLSAALPEGHARLHVALRLPGAATASLVVKRMADPVSALSLKLQALESPWQLEAAHATAHPIGGCVRVRLRPTPATVPLASLPAAAARAVELVRREAELLAGLPAEPFEVTREIVAVGDPAETAARAAWWALTDAREQPAQKRPARTLSALALSAHGKPPPAVKEAELDASFRAEVTEVERVPPDAPIAGRRQRVEPGQGELWVLVASPCALLSEGDWDAGRAGFAALAVASAARSEPGVRVEPWVTGDGVGVLAHASLLTTAEQPEELARRVARSAARTFASLPASGAFERAKVALLGLLGGDEQSAYAAFARAAQPSHPSWLAPWGTPERQTSVTLDDLSERWREVLHAPVRTAVLANVDEAQAVEAHREVDRFLLPAARERPCSESPPKEPAARAPALEVDRLLVGASLPDEPAGAGFAELARAALAGDGGLLEQAGIGHASVALLGGPRARALVIALPEAAAKERALGALRALGQNGLSEAQRTRAMGRALAHWRSRFSSPTERLGAVWSGQPIQPPAADEAWSSWLKKAFREDRLVVIE